MALQAASAHVCRGGASLLRPAVITPGVAGALHKQQQGGHETRHLLVRLLAPSSSAALVVVGVVVMTPPVVAVARAATPGLPATLHG